MKLIKIKNIINITRDKISFKPTQFDAIKAIDNLDLKFLERCCNVKYNLNFTTNVGDIKENISPIALAIKKKNIGLLTQLINMGANIHDKNFDNFSYAIKHSDSSMLRALVSRGANISNRTNKGITPLMEAIQNFDGKDFSKIKLLLKLGSSLVETNRLGDTALHFAIRNENKTILNFLSIYIIKTFKIHNLKTLQSCLPYAVESNDTIATQWLLNFKVNPNLNNPNILAIAVSNKNNNMLELLLKFGASPNLLLDKNLVSIAIKNQDIKAISLLLKYGANPSSQDNDGKNAFDYAKISNNKMIANTFDKIKNSTFINDKLPNIIGKEKEQLWEKKKIKFS